MPPLHLLIKPASSLCNMRCKYCFYSDVAENRSCPSYGVMTDETLEVLVRRAFDYADGQVGFAFQGGEPTLVGLDFYKKLIAFQQAYNKKKIPVYNSIQTNGLLIDDAWAEFLAKHHFLVGLSLDGTKEVHDTVRIDAQGRGTFDQVTQAAGILRRNHVDFNILCVVSDLVAKHPAKVYTQLKKYKYLQFIPCLDGFDEEKTAFSLDEDIYANFLKKTFDLYYRDFMAGHYVSIRNFDNYINILLRRPPESCAMSGRCTCYGVIEGDGSVYPCDFYVLDEWKLGHIAEHDFWALLGSTLARQFVKASTPVSEQCKGCKYYALCRGGCRREREILENNLPPINRHCKTYLEFFDYAIERMLEMARKVK